MFEQFIDSEIIHFFVAESKKYLLYKNLIYPQITAEEIRYFWDSLNDMKHIFVNDIMRQRRDRFIIQIIKFIRYADNIQIDMNDKLDKILPLICKLKKVCAANLDFDESMIKYSGRHGCKQFIRRKPIRFVF